MNSTSIKRFTVEKVMKWPSSSPDLNPIDNLWSSVINSQMKMKFYGKQHNSKADL